MSYTEDLPQNEKNSIDLVQVILISLSILMLTYSIIYLINYYTENDILSHYPRNFKPKNDKNLSPNEIGDSIGGILNPIIGITGSILTFLAFYIQYKANKEQRKFFYIGLSLEKQKKIEENNIINNRERKNHITNIKILKSLVSSMLEYYKSTSKNMEKFLLAEESKPLEIHLFKFGTNASYEYFEKLDFRDLYDSIVYSFQKKNENWEKDFIEILNVLNYYQRLIDEMRQTYRNHSKSKADTLNNVGEILMKEIGNVLADSELKDFNGVNDFLAIVYNRYPNNEQIIPDKDFKGTDFEKLQNLFFKKYLTNLHEKFNASGLDKYKNQLDLFSILNKRIGGEEFQSINYAAHLRDVYQTNFVDQTNFRKVENFMQRIETN